VSTLERSGITGLSEGDRVIVDISDGLDVHNGRLDQGATTHPAADRGDDAADRTRNFYAWLWLR